MKMLPLKFLLVLLFTIPALADHGIPAGKYNLEKTIKKEYTVNPEALLLVNNRYGNLVITSWTENRVVIEIHIKTTGDNQERVQRKLDEITVDFEASGERVSATTIFKSSKSNWSWGWGKSNNVNMQVNYTIKVPVKNRVDLSNDYGAIILDRIDGHAKINCDYGRLEIGELHGRNNQLSFDYTSRSTIGYMNSGSIEADYSGFSIEKTGNLSLTADYTNAQIHQLEALDYDSDYGKLEVGTARDIKGAGNYTNVAFQEVHGNIDLSSNYGSIQIGQMAPQAGNVQIRSNYTGVKLGYAADYHFNFELQAKYAGVRGLEGLHLMVSREKPTEKYYKGHSGNANTGKLVTITSNYGNITLTEN